MPLVTWDASYSVKVKSFDSAHQKLFYLLNVLHKAIGEGQDRTLIAGIVRELEKYTQTHFLKEEALMQLARYSKLNDHRLQHQKFVAKVKQFRDDLEAGAKCNSAVVLMFLKDWLAEHIKQTDKMYSEHLNSHGID